MTGDGQNLDAYDDRRRTEAQRSGSALDDAARARLLEEIRRERRSAGVDVARLLREERPDERT